MTKSKPLQKHLMQNVANLNTHYLHSPIIHYGSLIDRHAPRAGTRAPDVDFIDGKGNARRLAEFWRQPKHHLILFMGYDNKHDHTADIRALLRQARLDYPDTLRLIAIGKQAELTHVMSLVDDYCVDANDNIHQKYHVHEAAVLVIRPDQYIAYCATDLRIEPLLCALNRYLSSTVNETT